MFLRRSSLRLALFVAIVAIAKHVCVDVRSKFVSAANASLLFYVIHIVFITCLIISMQDINRYSCSEPDKIRHSTHILQQVFPLVMKLNEQQEVEKEIEAKVKGNLFNKKGNINLFMIILISSHRAGVLPSEICLEDAKCGMDGLFW